MTIHLWRSKITAKSHQLGIGQRCHGAGTGRRFHGCALVSDASIGVCAQVRENFLQQFHFFGLVGRHGLDGCDVGHRDAVAQGSACRGSHQLDLFQGLLCECVSGWEEGVVGVMCVN